MKTKFFTVLIAVIMLASCGTTQTTTSKTYSGNLIKQIDALVHDEAFAHAHWGVLIKSMDSGKIWYEHQSEKLFMPASNNKIPSTAAALKVLGPDFKFETHLVSDAEIKNGELQGDLAVWSNGDPTMYEKYLDDSRAVFHDFAMELKRAGISRIRGDIIGDDDAFDDRHIGEGWCLDYLDVWYAAPVGALQFNENYVDLRIIPPASSDEKADIEPNVKSSYFTIENQIEVVDTGSNDIDIERNYGSNIIRVSGRVKAGSGAFWKSPSIWNPTLFYVHVLKEVLEEHGIHVCGEARDCDEISDWTHIPRNSNYRDLAVYRSVPLSEIVRRCMKRSQNMYAETMPRIISWYKTGLGTFDGGREILDSVFVDFGIEPGTWVYSDGSGLNRYNYISPAVLVKILEGMYRDVQFRELWFNAFPIAGKDGTLKRRMIGTSAENVVRAKTGTISNTRGLSGYTETADGEKIVFSFLVNGHILSTKETERITDGILELICSYSGR